MLNCISVLLACALIIFSTLVRAEGDQLRSDDMVELLVTNERHVSYERLRELTIIRAAELARSRGYTHFEFMYSDERAVMGSVERQGDVVKDVYGKASETSFQSYLVPTPIRENQTVGIKFCNEEVSKCKGLSVRDAFRNLHR